MKTGLKFNFTVDWLFYLKMDDNTILRKDGYKLVIITIKKDFTTEVEVYNFFDDEDKDLIYLTTFTYTGDTINYTKAKFIKQQLLNSIEVKNKTLINLLQGDKIQVQLFLNLYNETIIKEQNGTTNN